MKVILLYGRETRVLVGPVTYHKSLTRETGFMSVAGH
jgi:hypothetical protein